MKAGGAVASSFVSGYVLNKWGSSLPMSSSKYGKVIYSVGIPLGLAYITAKVMKGKGRALAEGMVIGGLVMGINAIMQAAKSGTAAPLSNYPALQNMGVAGELGYSYYPGDASGVGTPITSAAFHDSAWGQSL
jgi:hypothetical protein